MPTAMTSAPLENSVVEACWQRICQAERVIIAAGSGMSMDAGQWKTSPTSTRRHI